MSSLTIVVLSCLVCIYAVQADDVCSPNKLPTLKDSVKRDWDITTEDMTLYFCQQSVRKPEVNYCKFTMTKAGPQQSKLEAFYYNLKTNVTGSDKYDTKLVDGNPGIYEDLIETPKVNCYVTEVDPEKQCMTYVDCFSGGEWGGEEESGAFVALICRDPKQCDDPKFSGMVDNIKKDLLAGNPPLEKIDHARCAELEFN